MGKDTSQMTVAELREAGYCVVMWNPEEIGDADVSDLEDVVITRGNDFLGIAGEEDEDA